jgi:cytidine deaminase
MIRLIEAARAARRHARAEYSGFPVGAALEGDDGTIFTGCNIESASYGLTICAERVALFRALSDGRGGFRRIAVVTDAREAGPPCGACRQVLWEHGGDLEVIVADTQGNARRYRLAELFPAPFDRRHLRP